MFYKKGHRVKNWKNRSWVVNDFSTAREMVSITKFNTQIMTHHTHFYIITGIFFTCLQPDDRQGQFRYYKPQEAADYDRDTSRDTVSNMLGLKDKYLLQSFKDISIHANQDRTKVQFIQSLENAALIEKVIRKDYSDDFEHFGYK